MERRGRWDRCRSPVARLGQDSSSAKCLCVRILGKCLPSPKPLLWPTLILGNAQPSYSGMPWVGTWAPVPLTGSHVIFLCGGHDQPTWEILSQRLAEPSPGGPLPPERHSEGMERKQKGKIPQVSLKC